MENIKDKIQTFDCDLNDLGSVIRSLKNIKPDIIYNMAAMANVHSCFLNPISVIQNNINTTLNLYEAIRILELNPLVVHISTSEVYGSVLKEDCPIKETHQLKPVNPYSVSKLTQEMLAFSYFTSFKIKTVITRSFTYLCPRRTDIFTSSFVKQIVEIEKKKRDILKHRKLKFN